MKYGFAVQSATNQQFLDTCPAVKAWEEHANHEGTDYFVFSYDDSVEVPIVPESVDFAQCESADDACWATR